jgi:hypothetical protein
MNDITVIVRYPGYTRRAVIGQNRGCQGWHIVKYLDEQEMPKRKRVCRKIECACGRIISAGQAWTKHQKLHDRNLARR